MFSMLRQRRLRWLEHVFRMNKKRIPRNILYGQLAKGIRRKGRPFLRFKDACKRDLTSCQIDPETWEQIALNRPAWRHAVKSGMAAADERRNVLAAEKRSRRKDREALNPAPLNSEFHCDSCGRICLSRKGLFSHSKKCYQDTRSIVLRE